MYLNNKPDHTYLVADIEANDLKPTEIFCMVTENLETGEVNELVGHEQIKKYVEAQGTSVIWVGHNFLSYDIPVLNRILDLQIPFSNCCDTLVLSFLYSPHIEGGHSLEAYGTRFETPKIEHNEWNYFSREMLARCRQDVHITKRLLQNLRKKMGLVGFSELSCEIEHGIREVVDWQQENGFYFDGPKAGQFYAELRTQEEAYRQEVIKQFPPQLKEQKTYRYRTKKDGGETTSYLRHCLELPKVERSEETYTVWDWQEFNLGSPVQRLQRLKELGYTAVNKTKAGAEAVDEDGILAFLEVCEEQAKPAIQALADWMVVSARARAVGEWLDARNPQTGAIHGRVFTCGATSRRCTHNKPNTANIPSNEARLGAECRALWRARPGRVLVGGDAKAVQMRMFAHYLGNEEVGNDYISGDPHTRNAEAAGIPRKKVKNCFYAMIFGAQDPKLGKTGHGGTGTAKQGSSIRHALYTTTPGLEGLFKAADTAYYSGSGWLQCIDGGWVRCPSPHAALNYWIQSAEAVLMKLTAIKVYRKIKKYLLNVLQVGFIHDELQYDCKDLDTAYKVGTIFIEAIAEAGRELNFSIPMAGDTKYALTWEGTH